MQAGAIEELFDETGLANPGFTGDAERSASPGSGVVQACFEEGNLALASDESWLARWVRHVDR
jgi:hypothetical protein